MTSLIGTERATMADAMLNAAIIPEAVALISNGSAADVQAAVPSAAADGRLLSVVSGGHDMFGRSIASGNVVLALRS